MNSTEPMSVEQAAVLADFARACKAAARSVSLYPATHPTIQASLARVSAAADRLTASGDVTVTVHPDRLLLDGRAAARPDQAIGELATLLHDRLVGALTIQRGASAEDWHALLLILARAADEVIAQGGIGQAWAASGRSHFDIREIDYAEVLRERAGGDTAEWDRIIALCLQGDAGAFDERALASLADAVIDPARFAELLDRFQNSEGASGLSVGARAAALLQLLHTALDAAGKRSPEMIEQALDSIAASSAKLTPEMMLAVLAERRSPDPERARAASAVVERMNDGTIASFVANSVTAERAATERLAQAFEALVPHDDRKEQLLERAGEEARRGELGQEEGFDELWKGAADMLRSYSDQSYVSEEYDRELTTARTHAIDVERLADDPPDRVQRWVATVSDEAVKELDQSLILDLLRIETDATQWEGVAMIAVREIERRATLGEFDVAGRLAAAIGQEARGEARSARAPAAAEAIQKLASLPLVRHMVPQLRKPDDHSVKTIGQLCHTIGPALVRPLAEALAAEENPRAIRALREILLDFGPAGRPSVEQLKSSSNPAVRRTAIDLLRVFGGEDALPELASMLGDADPQVQRDAVRAIVQIATPKAYAVLERVLISGSRTRDTILQQLLEQRDDKATPLLCYVLNHTAPRGKLAQVHAEIIEALGNLKPHTESTRTLRGALYRGEWWAPFKTAALRRAAAKALTRIGTPETAAVLEEAARQGSRGVRSAVKTLGAVPRRREGGRT